MRTPTENQKWWLTLIVLMSAALWSMYFASLGMTMDDLPSITKTINGGLNGLAARTIFTKRAMGALQ